MKVLDLSIRKVANRIQREIKFSMNPEMKQPNWYEIQDGLAKGKKIFVAKDLFSGWEDMVSGAFDQFIYKVAHEFVEDELGETPVIFDIGAHFGYSTLCFSALENTHGKAKVISFEPNPHNLEALKNHLDNNDSSNVEVAPLALSDNKGSFEMMISNDIQGSQSTGSYLNGVMPPLEKSVYNKFTKTVVNTETLDQYINDKGITPNILKIDVEGAEYKVLKGAMSWLKNNQPKKLLLIEVHNILAMHDCLNLIIQSGFITKVIDREDASTSRCFIKAVYSQ